MEAIKNAGACIGIVYKDGIVLVGEKQISSKLWIPERSEKFGRVDRHIVVAIAIHCIPIPMYTFHGM